MIDSDITGNITSDCQELMPTHETSTAHDANCTCDSCCQTSTSNCQENRDQCEETELSSGKVKTMKDKLTPMIASFAVVLAIVVAGLTSEIRASDIVSANIAEINRQVISDIHRVEIINANHSISRSTDVRVPIQQIDLIEISSNEITINAATAIAG